MIPVILSGGSGTRLWPVSRASYPKQFCEFFDQSFMQNSIQRVKPLGAPYLLTVESMQALTSRVASSLGVVKENQIYEPLPKNTGPAIALMCHLLQMRGAEKQVVGIFPADHLITDEKGFHKAVELGVKCADEGLVVTLGITPHYAATGYGYIEVQDNVYKKEKDFAAHMVKGFREKPDEKTAEKFLASGHHYWNAGMFIFRVDVMIGWLQKLAPEVWKKISLIKSDLSNAKIQYANIENISFDYAIMEKLEKQVCIPADIGWSDVGSWDELARLSEETPSLRSEDSANVFSQDALSNFVFSMRPKVVGLVGVDNLIVVDTPDALLIAKKGTSQKVKDLLDQVKRAGLPEATEHPFETRPWGGFEVLVDAPEFKTKRITVDPGQQLSYQSHTKREEHWIIIRGTAEVVLNDVVHPLKAGEHIHIPLHAKHRIRNPGRDTLIFVEVQTGSYFGEDDIRRYQDDYNRA